MSLPIDFKIDKIVKQIAVELNIPYDNVLAAVNQQITSTISGMERGDEVTWKYFGTFLATKNRIDNLNKTYKLKGKIPTLVDTGLIQIKF